jgi:membrane-associated protease RseP (regulator of RpoE activity)
MELFIRDCCPPGLAKRTVVTVVTSKHKNVGRTRVAIAVAAVLVVPALLNTLTNEVLRARQAVPGAFYLINGRPMHLYCSGHGSPTVMLDAGVLPVAENRLPSDDYGLGGHTYRRLAPSRLTDGHVHHHQIGVSVRNITRTLASGLGLDREEGVVIEDVIPEGPAASAGLMPGDIVLSVNERRVENIRQFALALYPFAVGEKAVLEIQRGK